MAGTTDLEAARIDMLAECAEEIADVAGMVLREPREKGKVRYIYNIFIHTHIEIKCCIQIHSIKMDVESDFTVW